MKAGHWSAYFHHHKAKWIFSKSSKGFEFHVKKSNRKTEQNVANCNFKLVKIMHIIELCVKQITIAVVKPSTDKSKLRKLFWPIACTDLVQWTKVAHINILYRDDLRVCYWMWVVCLQIHPDALAI